MKLKINIPEKVYEDLKRSKWLLVSGMRGGKNLLFILSNAVRNGRPIRKRVKKDEPEYNETIFRDTYGNIVSREITPIKKWVYNGEWNNTFGAVIKCPYCGAGTVGTSNDYCWRCHTRVKRLTCGGCSKYMTEDCHAESLVMDYSNICEDFEDKEEEK